MLFKKNDKNVIYLYIFFIYLKKMDLKLLYKVASGKYDPNKSQSNCLPWRILCGFWYYVEVLIISEDCLILNNYLKRH